MKRPRGWPLYQDLVGRKFRLLRTIRNGAGDIFPEGLVLVAGQSPTWSGMALTNPNPCPCGCQHYIRRVHPTDVELLPKEEP